MIIVQKEDASNSFSFSFSGERVPCTSKLDWTESTEVEKEKEGEDGVPCVCVFVFC